MSPIIPRSLFTAFPLRPFAIAAMAGATLLISSSAVVAADAAAPKQAQHRAQKETVEDRIAALHKSLQITADEETDWAKMAQVMRDNDSALKALIAARTTESREKVNALEDLQMYQKFAQAHVDGLKNLLASFETLYGEMPDSQKVIADGVFRRVGRNAKPSTR